MESYAPVSEDTRVELWRREELERLGFEAGQVEQLMVWNVDLHEAASLVNAGCELDTAMRILHPLP